MQKHRFHGLALDSEYRDRYQLYHTADGKVFDSRVINWRQVDWEKVVKIETFIRDQRHEVTCKDPRFAFFMVFRWAGQEWVNGKRIPVNVWTQGWSDGTKCYLMDIDFKLGVKTAEYTAPLSKFEAHIHPRVQRLTRRKKQHVGTIISRKEARR